MHDRFTMHRTVLDYRTELSSREQGDKESIETFSEAVIELVGSAFPNAPADVRDDLAKERFMRGVKVSTTVRERLYLGQPETLTDAIRLVHQLEAAVRASHGTQSQAARRPAVCGLTGEDEKKPSESKDVELLRKQLAAMEVRMKEMEAKKTERQPTAATPAAVQCFSCLEWGHVAARCPKRKSGAAAASVRPRVRCYRCGEEGHISVRCNRPGNGAREPTRERRFPARQ